MPFSADSRILYKMATNLIKTDPRVKYSKKE
jgi:hypothetical protein